MAKLNDVRIGVIGLGYVGLPLAVEFGRKYPTVGFDISSGRIAELERGHDATREVLPDELAGIEHLSYASDPAALAECNVYVVTVPTPIGRDKRPVLTPLERASETVGRVLKSGDTVVYESTVYPGCTEEICVPILERHSGLTFNKDFYAGYSPERINPGDREHRLPTIMKVTSGSTPETAEFVDALYGSIITAGTHLASSLKVAEAAKVIENTQRDVNIGLINELALLFDRLGIDTQEVLAAAGTKWNFLPFKPGLVGGHCIGVDPYYLAYKAQEVDFNPEMVLAGRRLNDSMGAHIAARVIKLMIKRQIQPAGARVLLLGLTFKENTPDVRNTKIADVVRELKEYGSHVDVHDPWADADDVRAEHGLALKPELEAGAYDAIVIAVAHREYVELGYKGIRALGAPNCVLFDIKHLLTKDQVDGRL